jgi:hypothetical protein
MLIVVWFFFSSCCWPLMSLLKQNACDVANKLRITNHFLPIRIPSRNWNKLRDELENFTIDT